MNEIKLNLEIERPIIFFDLETTGTDINEDKILEICAIKFMPDGTSSKYYKLLNPVKEISPEATEKHGHTNEDLLDMPKFEEIAEELTIFFDDSDLGGHNSNHFDIPFLVKELKRCNIDYNIRDVKMVDTRKIYLRNNPKELSHLYHDYTGKTLENAHSAEADILATVEIFNEQLSKYDISNLEEADKIAKTDKQGNRFLDLDGKFIKTVDGKYVFNFGKHKGEEVDIHHANFVNWMFSASFSDDTLFVAKTLINHASKKNQKAN